MERKEPMLAPRLGANIGSSFAGDWNQERRRNPSRYFIECFRVYLKTPNAPGQRTFSRCAAPFFLEIRQYSCEKMSCSAQKFLAAGHIGSFQIHPRSRPYRQCIGGSHTIYCTGSSTAMVVPFSELFSTQILPPWRLAISHAKESPKPTPPYSRLRDLSTRKNGWKMLC